MPAIQDAGGEHHTQLRQLSEAVQARQEETSRDPLFRGAQTSSCNIRIVQTVVSGIPLVLGLRTRI